MRLALYASALIVALAATPSFGGDDDLAEVEFLRGDINGDGTVDVADPVVLIEFLFQDGDAPDCLATGDTDGDDDFGGFSDLLFLLSAVFLEGTVIPEPNPDCGLDADTVLNLGCNNPTCP